ncbi:hypothetical protein BGZ51_000966 [Haplosporangium sp. Z 767]|nr:hypothetical protein BGZ51_000966 [Haplosporangium sp. Z 767]KAF9189723.1 hypothetical protein BGZ50_000591 [Haplosporangium sp. Z 11]
MLGTSVIADVSAIAVVTSSPNLSVGSPSVDHDRDNSGTDSGGNDLEIGPLPQRQLVQSNCHSHAAHTGNGSSRRSQFELDLGLRPPEIESDMSSNSSVRESSDYDTFGGSDSNDTDSIPNGCPLTAGMDRRSKRKRSMQRLLAKNRTLKSALTHAKLDLAAERHSRAVIDQIYLKIKRELNSKLEAEEMKVINMKAEMELLQQEMKELKEKTNNSSTSSSAYRIRYDSSPYSLSSGLGGNLMQHHSTLMDDQDKSDNLFVNEAKPVRNKALVVEEASLTLPTMLHSHDGVQDEMEKAPEVVITSTRWGTSNNGKSENATAQDLEAEVVNDKSMFDAVQMDTPGRTFAVSPTGSAHTEDPSSDSEDDEDAPCTMMEMLIKKQQSKSAEDEVQDPPADANETFDSMAYKFLHQARQAKFTPARTILQLDDLLLKYDALPADLILVLVKEFVKWWEQQRMEAGGPATGGWGIGTVLMPGTEDKVGAKIAVETKFKAIYVPLLLNYVATHQEQMMLLEKLELIAKTNDRLSRNHVAQLMALYKFDVLDADAILEWWKKLKEPMGVFGHSDELRSMSSKFVAWLEDEEDDSDDDSDDDDDDDLSEQEEEDDSDDENRSNFNTSMHGQGRIIGLNQFASARHPQGELLSPSDLIKSLDEDLANAEAEKEGMMVIELDDDAILDDQKSTTSSLEWIEECDRRRRISFCTNTVYINQDGRVDVDRMPAVNEHSVKSEPGEDTKEEVEEE